MGAFETSDDHGSPHHKPVRVPTRWEDIYGAALEMVADLEAWELVSKDETQGVIVCKRQGGFLAGEAAITIKVEGPDGIPSSTVHVRSETQGGLRSRDKANVAEFVKPFHRRVC